MQDFRQLKVWHKSRQLAIDIQPAIGVIEKRKPRLADQLERAIESIGANIAEACGRETRADKKKFLTTSISSTTESEHHLIRAHDHGLLTTHNLDRFTSQLIEIRKMLHSLRNKL